MFLVIVGLIKCLLTELEGGLNQAHTLIMSLGRLHVLEVTKTRQKIQDRCCY